MSDPDRPEYSGCCESTDGILSDCCSGPSGQVVSAALEEIRSEEVDAEVAATRSAGFRLLYERGQPVTLIELAEATGIRVEQAIEIVEAMRTRGRVELDDRDRVIGLAGLSLTPSRHEIIIDGQTRWAWCALDAIGIAGALKATGVVRSTDPQTGETLNIPFVQGHPDTEAHIFILDGYAAHNVRNEWCPRVNFFADRKTAAEWVADQGVDGDLVSITEVVKEAAAMWETVTTQTP